MSSLAETYERIDKLGEGTYGIVYKAKDRRSQDIVALKRMVPVNEAEGIPGTTMREIAFLRELRHPNIVTLKDVVFNVPKLTLVFECCEMDLARYLRSKPNRQLDPPEIKSFMRQFLKGLAFMHGRAIIHRDLKPHNLLLRDDATVLKIADFGLARMHGIPVKKYRHDAVTLWYRPPDLLMGSIMYGFSMDLWSAGCIFAEMIAGCVFLQAKTEVDQLCNIFDMFGYPSAVTRAASSGRASPVPGSSGHTTVHRGGNGVSREDSFVSAAAASVTFSAGGYPSTEFAPPSTGFPSFQRMPSPLVTAHSFIVDFNRLTLSTTDDPSCLPMDPMPNFAKYPNFDQMMDRGLVQHLQQRLRESETGTIKPGFDVWVAKYNAVEKIGEDGVDLLRQMLQLDPARRITAADALRHPYLRGDDCGVSPSSNNDIGVSCDFYSSASMAAAANEAAIAAVEMQPIMLAFDMLWGWPSGGDDYGAGGSNIHVGPVGPLFGGNVMNENDAGEDSFLSHNGPQQTSFTPNNGSPPSAAVKHRIPVPPRAASVSVRCAQDQPMTGGDIQQPSGLDSGGGSSLPNRFPEASNRLPVSSQIQRLSGSWGDNASGQSYPPAPREREDSGSASFRSPRRVMSSSATTMVHVLHTSSDQVSDSAAAASSSGNVAPNNDVLAHTDSSMLGASYNLSMDAAGATSRSVEGGYAGSSASCTTTTHSVGKNHAETHAVDGKKLVNENSGTNAPASPQRTTQLVVPLDVDQDSSRNPKENTSH